MLKSKKGVSTIWNKGVSNTKKKEWILSQRLCTKSVRDEN